MEIVWSCTGRYRWTRARQGANLRQTDYRWGSLLTIRDENPQAPKTPKTLEIRIELLAVHNLADFFAVEVNRDPALEMASSRPIFR